MTYVFDLDGTIIDSKARHWQLMKKLLKEHGAAVYGDFAESYMGYKADGHSGLKYLTNVMGLKQEFANMIQHEWIEHIEDDEWLRQDRLYDDAIPALARITERIIFLTIRNNTTGLLQELNRLGLNGYKVIILKQGENKAEPLKQLQDECIMIGDTEIDYQAATEAGVHAYVLNRGFRSQAYWSQRGIASYDDLGKLLQQNNF